MSERKTEELFLKEAKCTIGDNPFGCVYAQGNIKNISTLENLLKEAGGKPKECALDDYTKGGTGKAMPEYIITLHNEPRLLIVIECKASVKKHCSSDLNHPKDYAVDGALYYAKFLKKEYDDVKERKEIFHELTEIASKNFYLCIPVHIKNSIHL